MTGKSIAKQATPATPWRKAIFYNRTNTAFSAHLDPSEAIRHGTGKIVESSTTYVWGLRVDKDITIILRHSDGEIGRATLPYSGGQRTISIIVDYNGVRVIVPSERKSPGELGGINRVQVGCGPANLFPDWWNVDIRKFNGIDAAIDVTNSWPYKNLDYVYGEQFIEHLDLDGALKFLVAAGRSLKPGGILRLTTPNLEWVLASHYAKTRDIKDIITGTLAMNRAFHGWGHKFLYSPAFIETLCRKVGYSDVRFYNYGESEVLDLANLERHGGFKIVDGKPNHIIMEAEAGDPEIMNQDWRPFLHKHFLKYYFGGH